MGYDIERFVGYVNKGLLCCICQDVLEDPLQAPCEHAFCASCIHGWLVHHSNCPEDRQALHMSMLGPLYRYMRNDLNRLQLHCRNGERGCEMVCSLELVERHERECEYGWISCTNTGCPVQVERHNLNGHLVACEYRSQECPKGCGYTVFNLEDMQHNCIAELRSEVELLRSEIYSAEEAKHEMESRLDSQRQHMVQKESLLKNEIGELKSQISQMMSSVQSLIGTERELRQEIEQTELKRQELMELLKSLQVCRLTTADGNERSTSFHSLTRLESMKKKQKTGR
ncbi:RING finger protein 151-like [Dromiciops gliroides]|uniref:RING finger protein 151-like n=1 Tax=Dromiciops gliroides TaxID=33562 RepID=UPI001CC51D3A|nr:RING finger protein 151-like [Dromiciops gliroides]XP_043832925.1 RING finger protein 151-like [Dromiciops gliroides]